MKAGIVASLLSSRGLALSGFQPIVMNFRTGQYTVGGQSVPVTSLIGGASFDETSISASGMLVGYNMPANYPEALGNLQETLQLGLINGMTMVVQWSKEGVGSNNSGVILRAYEIDTDSDYVGVETFQSSPAINVQDGFDINFNHTVAWVAGNTARQRIAFTLARDNGTSGYEYAASGNGSTPTTDEASYLQYSAATFRLFGVAEDFLSVNDWYVEYLEIMAAQELSALPSLSTPVA